MRQTLVSLLKNHLLITFLITLFFTGCREQQPASQEQVVVFWEEGKATGLIIPKTLVSGIADESIAAKIRIRLAKQSSQQTIAGSFRITENEIWFEPLIPFTRGLQYELYISDSLIHEFQIPEADESPKLVSIYPSQDTLPENLLKIYLVFSKAMSATSSLQHVVLRNQQGDTLNEVFLDLQQELWNEERTVLTLWMDPGRVKRDLQPNQLLGGPLQSGKHYQLIIEGEWRAADGKALNVSSTKKFVVAQRDDASPSADNWKLQIPQAASKDELVIQLDEPLDNFLLKNTIEVVDPAGKALAGIISIGDEEKSVYFKPVDPWTSGVHLLKIEARLEDLAGNNLNRPFDRDLKNKSVPVTTKEFFEKKFAIQ